MTLKKFGSPTKIIICKKGAMAFDPNILVREIVKKWGKRPITIDQIHEAAKALGIIDYNSEDMNTVINLLQSSGVPVEKA